jgi:hypothetical protein
MRRRMAGVVIVLAVGAAGYGVGRARNEARILRNVARGIMPMIVQADGGAQVQQRAARAAEAPKWAKVRAPLKIDLDEKMGYVSTGGFWELTDASKDKEPLVPVAVKIECTEYNNTCGVVQAGVFPEGVLEPAFFNYYVATWTNESIVATDFDEGPCGLGHHLWLDLKNNRVTDTDYLKSESKGQNCPAAALHAYELRGGTIMLRPPAGWG